MSGQSDGRYRGRPAMVCRLLVTGYLAVVGRMHFRTRGPAGCSVTEKTLLEQITPEATGREYPPGADIMDLYLSR